VGPCGREDQEKRPERHRGREGEWQSLVERGVACGRGCLNYSSEGGMQAPN